VVLGYGLLSVVGTVLFATESVNPDPVTGILVAGLGYSLVFGALGAVVASVTGSSEAGSFSPQV
jgi:hypothetical protein